MQLTEQRILDRQIAQWRSEIARLQELVLAAQPAPVSQPTGKREVVEKQICLLIDELLLAWNVTRLQPEQPDTEMVRNRRINARRALEHAVSELCRCDAVDAPKPEAEQLVGDGVSQDHLFSKWCEYCRKHGHTDAECWCTRAAPPLNHAPKEGE